MYQIQFLGGAYIEQRHRTPDIRLRVALYAHVRTVNRQGSFAPRTACSFGQHVLSGGGSGMSTPHNPIPTDLINEKRLSVKRRPPPKRKRVRRPVVEALAIQVDNLAVSLKAPVRDAGLGSSEIGYLVRRFATIISPPRKKTGRKPKAQIDPAYKDYDAGIRVKPDQIVWHYTDGNGLLGILQSSKLYATQVSALNDSKETKHATELFAPAIKETLQKHSSNPDLSAFVDAVLHFADAGEDSRLTSKFFVTCISGEEDDLTQWDRYGKGNGYAIGFRGLHREPNSTLFKVVYETDKHQNAVKQLAEATVDFYL
jgi:hypothetical protein